MTTPLNQPIDFSKIQRVLVTKLRFHGDVLLSSPVFEALKKHYPHLQIDALVYEETREMLSLHPAIDHIFCIDKKWNNLGVWQKIKRERQLLKQLANQQYDLLIHLTEHWRGFYLKHWLNIPLAVTAHYPRRDDNKLWRRSFSHFYPVPPARHKAASHIDALRCLGLNAGPQAEQLSLMISDDDQAEVDHLLTQYGLHKKTFILVHPTSRFFYKCWPPSTMASFINKLVEQGNNVVITAAPNEKETLYINTMMQSTASSVLNLSGQLSLKQLGAIIKRSLCFVGVDSAPMHIAVAVGAPIVALFGPTDADVWGPNNHQSIIIQSATTSKPALVNGERPNDLENCTLDIAVDTVVAAVQTLKNLSAQNNTLTTDTA